mgnify:CR=1 FL=1
MAAGETQGRAGAGRLVAVVVTYNRLEMLKKTLVRLLETPPEALEAVLVVDNACTDGTTEWLAEQRDPRLSIIRSETNIGGAGGFEIGMRAALERFDPDWLVVMDDDARPCPGALEGFHAAPRPDDLAPAAAVYFPDGGICEMNRPSINPFWRPRVFLRTLWRGMTGQGSRDGYHIPYAAYTAEGPTDIDLTSFVGLFLSRRMVETVGLPDGHLFLYGDDVIYTLGLRKAGFRIQFDPDLRFEHDCSTFENDRRRVFRPLWKVYYTYRNGLLMYRRAAGPLFWLLVPGAALKWALVGRRYGADRRRYNRLLRRALLDALREDTRLTHAQVLELAGQGVSR